MGGESGGWIGKPTGSEEGRTAFHPRTKTHLPSTRKPRTGESKQPILEGNKPTGLTETPNRRHKRPILDGNTSTDFTETPNRGHTRHMSEETTPTALTGTPIREYKRVYLRKKALNEILQTPNDGHKRVHPRNKNALIHLRPQGHRQYMRKKIVPCFLLTLIQH